MAYQYKNTKGTDYYLHSRDVQLRGSNKKQTIYFFAKIAGIGGMDQVPAGYEVVENTRTGLPVLRRNSSKKQ